MDTYKVVTWGTAVGIGVSQSSYVHLEAIGKGNSAQFPYCVANEIVAAEIGRRLRLPIPPCCIAVDASANPRFCSLNFNLTGNALPPVIPTTFALTFPAEVADILVFDTYICNTDRHVGNLAADYGPPARYNLFDHSHALLGGNRPIGISRLNGFAGKLAIAGNHCLINQISDDRLFERMLGRVETLEEYFLLDLVESTSDYGVGPAEVTALKDFLLNRRSEVRKLILSNKAAFPGITQWSLS